MKNMNTRIVLCAVFVAAGSFGSMYSMLHNELWQYLVSSSFLVAGLMGLWVHLRVASGLSPRLPFRIIIVLDENERWSENAPATNWVDL